MVFGDSLEEKYGEVVTVLTDAKNVMAIYTGLGIEC